MKKLLVVGIIILLVWMSVPSTGINVEKSTASSNGNILYVGGSGPGNYSKIQDAIDNASDWDTVFVYEGMYYENVIVDKSIDLIGKNQETTQVKGCFIIEFTSYVNIKGFNIDAENKTGILVKGLDYYHTVRNCIIKENIITSNTNGIKLNRVSKNIIINNLLKANVGILLEGGDYISECNGNIIHNNSISSYCKGLGSGIWIKTTSGHPQFPGECAGNLINNTTISDFKYGIFVDEILCYGTTISNNKIVDNSYGINIDLLGLYHSKKHPKHIISGNFISNNIHGISCNQNYNYHDNIISNNSIGLITKCGGGVKRNTFENNSKLGLNVIFPSSIVIEENNFINNSRDASFYKLLIFPFYIFFSPWNRNYWDDLKNSPYLIFGYGGLLFSLIKIYNSFMCDWHPAKEPYDIGV